jgi:NADPH:quinone reductase-like Zn-dependent oxidoreductase
MRAARVHKPGPPDVIAVEDIDLPEPGEREVLVRVSAAGVGPWDALVRTGSSGLPLTYPVTLGSEISGVTEKLGPNIDEFTVGDEIFGATNPSFINGYAEYAIATAGMIARRPASLSHLEAAALPVVGVTAWQMLFDHGRAREGQTVVVHGSAGNVGAYAVQLARSRKLRVIGTIFGGDPGYVRGLGADQVIDTKSQSLAELDVGADIVIDTVGGKNQDQLFGLLKSGGIIVSSVIQPNVEFAKQRGVQSDYFIVDVNTDQLTQLAQLHERHELTIPVGSVLPLTQAIAAHEMLAGTRPHQRGKIVIEVNPG